MHIGEVFIDAVTVPSGRRPVDAATVERLVDSIGRIGLQQPISVWSPDSETVVLVAGNHRLEAMRRLGEHKVPAVFVDMDELDRELWEIVENLHRLDLTKDQRDRQIRRYAELLKARDEREAANIQSAQSAPIESKRDDGRGHRPQGIASKVAAETGLSKATVNRVLNPKPKSEPKPDRSATKAQNASEDRDLASEAAEKVAELLAEHIPGHLWDGVKANLNAAGARNIAKAFTRLTGVSVFDNSEAGTPDSPFAVPSR